jgi:hypothetical protein
LKQDVPSKLKWTSTKIYGFTSQKALKLIQPGEGVNWKINADDLQEV